MKKSCLFVLTALILLFFPLPVMAEGEDGGELVNITLSGVIDFGSVEPPVTDQSAAGQGQGIPAVTITVEPETNVIVDISIKGAVTAGSLALSNWKYSTTFAGTKTSLTDTWVEVYDSAPQGANDFYHWIDIPEGTDAGTHQISIDYKAAIHTP